MRNLLRLIKEIYVLNETRNLGEVEVETSRTMGGSRQIDSKENISAKVSKYQ